MDALLQLRPELQGAQLLLVGAGVVGQRRLERVLAAGFKVTVVDPNQPNLPSQVTWLQQEFTQDLLRGKQWVIAATHDAELNAQIAALCHQQGIWVNVASDAQLSSFSFPAKVNQGPFRLTISAQGLSPGLLKNIKQRMTLLLPSSLASLAELVGQLRPQVKAALTGAQRQKFWRLALGSQASEYLYWYRPDVSRRIFQSWLDAKTLPSGGELYLIGAGPGDAELLTLKGARLLQQADVVLYDRLISDEILRLSRPDAQRIYVGKRKDQHELPQTEINELLVHYCQQGLRVARLKGGDPFIFGRGGEELAQIAALGIPFQVVPGVTAASGAAAYAGIPLTHRDHAWSVRFVTAHRRPGAEPPWPSLVEPGQTLVFYMGLQQLPLIVERLQAFGMDQNMPVAVISEATTSRQQCVRGLLVDIEAQVAQCRLPSPALIIVGSVVELAGSLDWFGPMLATMRR